jgi:phage tail-like protein
MRGLLPAVATPHPVAHTLPGLYEDDSFVQRFCSGLDVVLAPVLYTLDSLSAYLDPGTAPDDVLEWLAGWVGIALDGSSDPRRRRELVRSAFVVHRLRGTAEGIRRAVAVAFDAEPEVRETGAAGWSADPTAPVPGTFPQAVVVRLRIADPSPVDLERLDAVVAAVKPAHVPHRVEIVGLDPPG